MLEEILGSLRIIEEYDLNENKTTELGIPEENMLIVLVLAWVETIQVIIPKSMVSDSEWFDGDWTKFKDWWREIYLFLKSNRVIVTNDKIIAVLV